MTKNVGTLDKAVRISVAAVIGLAISLNWVSGTLVWVLGTVGVAMVATSMVSFCGLYSIFGITTCKIAR